VVGAGCPHRGADLLDAHPRLGLVNAHILVGPDERDDPICLEMAESPLPPGPRQPGHPLLSFIACAAMVRRDAFLAVGGFHPRLSVGGEEEVLGTTWSARAGSCPTSRRSWSTTTPRRIATRTSGGRSGIRNTLWTTWLRRPLRAAVVRTLRQVRQLPRDRVTLRGLGMAVAGLPWIVRDRRVSPPHVEEARRLLEDQQLGSKARRYVS
jgi:hypothetical protein